MHKRSPIRLFRQCPICGHAYGGKNMTRIDGNDAAELMHIACTACGAAILAFVSRHAGGISAVATVTDLTPHDARRAVTALPITEDDLFSFHHAVRATSFARTFMKYAHPSV